MPKCLRDRRSTVSGVCIVVIATWAAWATACCLNEQTTVVRFDPMPEAAHGDVFHLTLEDGRILECQVLNEYTTYCAVIDGPRIERRHHRRPAPMARAYQ